MKIIKKIQNWYENLGLFKQTLYSSLIVPFIIFFPNFLEILYLVLNTIMKDGFNEAFLGTYKLCFNECGQFQLNSYIFYKYFYAGYLIVQSFLVGLVFMSIWNGISFFKKRKKLKIVKIKA